jgi:hypothetical protein
MKALERAKQNARLRSDIELGRGLVDTEEKGRGAKTVEREML